MHPTRLLALPITALVLAGCGSVTSEPDAATPSTPTAAPRTYLTAVPADLPLDAGPRGQATDWQPTEDEPPPVYVCGPNSWTPGTDHRGVTVFDEDDNELRDLTLYPDDAAAAAALARISTDMAECPEQDQGKGSYVAPRPLTSDLGEEAVAWLEQYGDGDGPNGEGMASVATRVGNAVLVLLRHVPTGAEDLDEAQRSADQAGESAVEVVDAMCAFSAEGCADEIPAGFGLDTGLAAGGETRVIGPARSLDGVDLAAVCAGGGVGDWPYAPDDRLAVRATGPEYAETRELLVYPDDDAATDALASVQADVEGCTAKQGQAVDVLSGEPGGDASFTFAQTYEEGLGGTIYQLVRSGRALLVVSSTGELLRETVQTSTDAFTEGNRKVVALLCGWTEAGC